MRKVKTGIAGGFGFQYSDYIYLQAGAQDAANALCDMFGIQQGDIVLLTSKLTTDNSGQYPIITLTEGYAFFIDKLIKVPAQTINQDAASQVWVFNVVENVLGGTKIFESGQTYDTYVEEILQVSFADEVPEGSYGLPDIKMYQEYGFNLVTASASFVGDNPMYRMYWRKCFNTYQFKGSLQANTGGNLTAFSDGNFFETTKRGWLYAVANDSTKKQIAYEFTKSTLTLYDVSAYDIIYFDELMLSDI